MPRDIDRYRADYLADYGFERVLVAYRAELVIEQLEKYQPDRVLEVGCGEDLLYRRYLEKAGPVSRWVVVEPAGAFCEQARNAALPGMQVIHGLIEASSAGAVEALGGPADMVILSGVLNEVADPQRVLTAIRLTMRADSVLHVNVPSANSFHRQLAVCMGLIDDLAATSDRNRRLQQHRVYDLDGLTEELHQGGFSVRESGGHFVKPFTHAQMEEIAPTLGESVLRGLYRMGKSNPDLACEIFVNASVR